MSLRQSKEGDKKKNKKNGKKEDNQEDYIFIEDKNHCIGKGMFGEVYKGSYKNERRVIIKILNVDEKYFDEIKKRISEIKILEGNNYENENFTKYLEETEIRNGKLYIGMETCNTNMKDYLKNYKPNNVLDIGEIYDFLSQLKNTFQIMSSKKIYHGNITLENILVNFEEKKYIFKLTGFEIIPELIKLYKNENPKEMCQYLPPEILESDDFTIDQKTDLWSVGVIIYFLSFGELPFKGESCSNVLNEIKNNTLQKTHFTELDDLIHGLLTVDKEKRFSWSQYFEHPFFKNNGFWQKYNLVQEIGESLVSRVYKAIDKNDGKIYSLKLIDFEKIKELENNKNNQTDIIEEIKEKIKNMKRLSNDNPDYFIEIYEIFYLENGIAFTMELLDYNLKQYINRIENPKASHIFYFLFELNKIFQFLQKRNLIIGELRLENILHDKQKNIWKISNVGPCPKFMKLIKKYSEAKETLVNLAPELNDNDKYESISDMWALGIIIHYFRFKSFPYDASSFKDIMNQINSGKNKICSSNNQELNDLIEKLLAKDPKKRMNWDDYFRHPFFTNRNYLKYYKIGDKIHEGDYYNIYKATEIKTNEEKVIKVIDKDNLKKIYLEANGEPLDEKILKQFIDLLIKQTEIMKSLEEDEDGKNINTIKFFEYFNTPTVFAIVIEKCDLSLNDYFTEKEEIFDLKRIKEILLQLNNTFKNIAKKKMIHGDLKLANILLKKENNKYIYKLTDYGVSREFLELANKFNNVSNLFYTAPEVLLEDNLSEKMDLWSLGIIIYILKYRDFPYRGTNSREILNSIDNNKLKTSNDPQFDNLIRRLLTKNAKERLTWEEYLIHPFIAEGTCWIYYEVIEDLGNGPYYKVCKVKGRTNNEKRAIKVINLKKIRNSFKEIYLRPPTDEEFKIYINDFIQETENMKLLSGPNQDNINAVIFYNYFLTQYEFCIEQELCDGNLRDLVFSSKKIFKPNGIYQILSQLNNSFRILQKKNLSHKDLRLEKILYQKNPNGKDYIYKLTGLEFNKNVDKLLKIAGGVNNNKYAAPEILNNEKSGNISETDSQKADLWSLGIIIFILYFGEFPYKGNNARVIHSNIMRNEGIRLNEISDPNLRDLLKKLLTIEPEDRIDWNGYFAHEFFKNNSSK